MNSESSQKRIAFGYNREPNGKIILHPGQAAVVKLIYTWYLEGKSLSSIKELLEDNSIPSPQNKPTWGKQTLSNILTNPHYLGSEIYPEIIDRVTFDAAQTVMAKKAK